MPTFEQFSQQISDVSQFHSRRLLGIRFMCWCEYWWRRCFNMPYRSFKRVDSEGEPVGEPIEITHLTLHDMMEHQAVGVLTDKVLLEGLRANAFRMIRFERLDEFTGKTIIQPCWIGL